MIIIAVIMARGRLTVTGSSIWGGSV